MKNGLKSSKNNAFLSIWADIVQKLNSFLYVKPQKKDPKVNKEEIIALRKKVSNMLFEVLSEKRTVLNAVSNFPKNSADESVNVCFHILMHLEADEDIRAKDPVYREEQDDFILYAAELLQKGESLPINIIKEYNGFYKETLVYPEINRETVIARLKKFINI